MKAIRSIALIATALALSASTVSAQPAEIPPLPPGPLIQPVPKSAKWEVTIKRTESRPQSDGIRSVQILPVRFEVTKAANARHDRITYTSGEFTDLWTFDGIQVSSTSGDDQLSLSEGPGSIDYVHTGGNAFPGFEWIGPAQFRGIKDAGGRRCLVFESETTVTNPYETKDTTAAIDPAPLPKVVATAYIDLETRLPVQLVTGSESQTYKFHNPPAGPLAIPQNVLRAAQERSKRVREIMDSFPRRK